jgi:hypothetical protein
MISPPKYGGGCKLMPKGRASVVRSRFSIQFSRFKYAGYSIFNFDVEPETLNRWYLLSAY